MDEKPFRVIGLTGVPSVGKGEAVRFLREWAEGRGWRVGYLSFSDQIKEEALARGLSATGLTRERISVIVTEMREAGGPAVLAERILAKIRQIPEAERAEVFVIEAVRHVAEIEFLRQALGTRFRLFGVVADLDTIAERLLARARPDESREAMRGKPSALAMIRQELRGQAKARGVDVGACIEQADVVVENSGTLDDLRKAVWGAAERHA